MYRYNIEKKIYKQSTLKQHWNSVRVLMLNFGLNSERHIGRCVIVNQIQTFFAYICALQLELSDQREISVEKFLIAR